MRKASVEEKQSDKKEGEEVRLKMGRGNAL